jgi:hypothetical protein
LKKVSFSAVYLFKETHQVHACTSVVAFFKAQPGRLWTIAMYLMHPFVDSAFANKTETRVLFKYGM